MTDARLTLEAKECLASLVGQTFEKYRFDQWEKGESDSHVWGTIEIDVGQRQFALIAKQERHQFFDIPEDIAVVSFVERDCKTDLPHLVGSKLRSVCVGKEIKSIRIYEDEYSSTNVDDGFSYLCTAAIVFQFDRNQLVFESDGWIMEMFCIETGKDAENRIRAAGSFFDEDDLTMISVKRNIVEFGV